MFEVEYCNNPEFINIEEVAKILSEYEYPKTQQRRKAEEFGE